MHPSTTVSNPRYHTFLSFPSSHSIFQYHQPRMKIPQHPTSNIQHHQTISPLPHIPNNQPNPQDITFPPQSQSQSPPHTNQAFYTNPPSSSSSSQPHTSFTKDAHFLTRTNLNLHFPTSSNFPQTSKSIYIYIYIPRSIYITITITITITKRTNNKSQSNI